MSLPPFATLDDVAKRIGEDIDQPDRVEDLIDHASALVRGYCGWSFVDDTDNLVDAPAVAEIRGVVVGMVERVLDNPHGIVQSSTGPLSDSYGPAAAERIYLNKNDKIILDRFRVRSPLWALPTTRGPVETPSVQVSGLPDPSIWLD